MKEKEKGVWCRLPYDLLRDERLTPADAVVYAVLADVLHDGRTDIKQADIAKLTGLCERQVRYSLTRLEKTGYIVSRRTDGRRLFLELAQVLPPLKQTEPRKRKAEQEQEENPEHVEEALRSILTKKLKVKRPEHVDSVYSDLKAQASARVKDKSKALAYLSKMISNYVDNSDGFDADEYEHFLNNF